MLIRSFRILHRYNFSTSIRPSSNDSWLGCYDVVVIGGGIVGMASAKILQESCPNLSIALVEKEADLAMHQSGHNSGVIHGGIYYKPGSLKAQLCTQGMNLSYKYFHEKNIPYKKVGKLIVATEPDQLSALDDLYRRGIENNVPDLKILNSEEIRQVEPNCIGLRALHSPQTGIVDWALVTKHYAEDFRQLGGDLYLNFQVARFESLPESSDTLDINKYPVALVSSDGKRINGGFVLACAGLHSDKLAILSGGRAEPTVVPVRGEYLLLSEEKQHLVRGNIYPVPNPKYPFLGVHCTPRMDGSVWLGPNAVLAFKREGYSYSDVSLDELMSTLKDEGFQKLAKNNLKFGLQEFAKSLFLSLQLKELQKFIPQITLKDLRRGFSGVRAQALSKTGELVDDFVFEKSGPRILHCRNAPSPAATSSLAIARIVADKVLGQMKNLSS